MLLFRGREAFIPLMLNQASKRLIAGHVTLVFIEFLRIHRS